MTPTTTPSNHVKLKLLPLAEYIGANRTDPIRFYFWPLIGRLYRRRVEMCLSELTGGQSILEVGFGSGLTFLHLREQYREIHGIDLESDIDAVSQLWKRHGLEADLRNGDVLALPYADETFDSVLLISILEHLKPEQQAKAMAEIRRVLKPGGQLVYGVPIERPLMVFMFRMLGYNIRELHFSTEKEVREAAAGVMRQVRVRQMKGTPMGRAAVYEVGHFVK